METAKTQLAVSWILTYICHINNSQTTSKATVVLNIYHHLCCKYVQMFTCFQYQDLVATGTDVYG